MIYLSILALYGTFCVGAVVLLIGANSKRFLLIEMTCFISISISIMDLIITILTLIVWGKQLL